MWIELLFLNLVTIVSFPVAAVSPPAIDPVQVSDKFKSMTGLTLDSSHCRPNSFSEGKGTRISFIEMTWDCGDLSLQIEVSQPMLGEQLKQQVSSELARVQESYSAMKNPYAGFVSETTQCPVKENFWQEKPLHKSHKSPMLFGRLTERGAWGACGRQSEDFWGALTFLESRDALLKVRITGKKRVTKAHFVSVAHKTLQSFRNAK